MKAKFDLDQVLEISLGMEATTQKAKEFKDTQRTQPVMAVQTPGAGPVARPNNRRAHCGCGNHDQSECKFHNAKCHECWKVGHIVPVCRSRVSASKPQKSTPRSTKWVDTTTDSEPKVGPSQSEPLFVVRDRVTPPYLVEVKVNGLPLQMEVDSGAAVSLATETAVASLLSTTELQSTDTVPILGNKFL